MVSASFRKVAKSMKVAIASSGLGMRKRFGFCNAMPGGGSSYICLVHHLDIHHLDRYFQPGVPKRIRGLTECPPPYPIYIL